VLDIATGWATLLLFGGGPLLLRVPDTLHRVLALALLALTSTLVAARYVTRGGPF